MSFFNYIGNIFKPFKVKEIQKVTCCPACGSENILEVENLSNFVEVVNNTAFPKYRKYLKCQDCHYFAEME